MSKEKIIEVLSKSTKPLKTKEITELSDVDAKEVGRIIKVLKAENLIGSPKRCFYELKA